MKMTRARVQLLLSEPFFGSLLLNLQSQQNDAIPTMATDGHRLLWSSKFVDQLGEAETRTILAHEVMHCALLHQLRRQQRDPQAWNQAADHAVNLILEECNAEARGKGRSEPFPWPKEFPVLRDAQFKGKSAEEIYNLMPSQQGQQPGNGPGEVWDDPGSKDEASTSQEEANWKKTILDAAKAAKQVGTMPAEMRKLVEDILNPKASWREILRRFVSDHAKDDYSWTRPNPRYASSGFILPSLYSQRLGVIGIIRDTSGSTQDWQAEILAELSGIIHECQPSKVIVIDADAAVARVLELEPTDPLPTDAIGGGGTDFRPALAKLEEYDIRCAVYITDLAGTFGDAPSFPVLWATNERDAKVPFGEIIEV